MKKVGLKIVFLISIFILLLIGTNNSIATSINIASKEILNSQSQGTFNIINENNSNITSKYYLVSELYSYIGRILPKTTTMQFKNNFSITSDKIHIYKDDELKNEINSGYVGTNMVVKFDGVEKTYKISVIGDFDGDGLSNQIEVQSLIKHIVFGGEHELKGLIALSADINKDNAINQVDLNILINYIVFGRLSTGGITKPEKPNIEVVSGDQNDEGIYLTDVTIKITPTETVNAEKTVYTMSGTKEVSETIIPEDGQITLTDDGIYTISSYTYAKDGSKSDVTKLVIKKVTSEMMDDQIGLKIKLDNEEGEDYTVGEWTSHNICIMTYPITVKFGDNTEVNIETKYTISGAKNVPIPVKNATLLTTNGEYEITAIATDEFGRTKMKTYQVKIDKDVPENSSIAIIGSEKNENEYYNKNLTVTVTHGSDELSGIDKVIYQMTGANSAEETEIEDQGTISITQEGTTNLIVKTYDKAGNVATLEEEIKLDKNITENSSIAITGGEKNAKEWYNKDLTVTVTHGSDAISGLDKVTYQLSGASTVGETEIEDQETIPITQNGTTNLIVKTYDKAGNIATLEEEIKLDKDLPTNSSIKITGGAKNNYEYYNKELTVTVTHGSDSVSGIDKVTYRMTGANSAEETEIGDQGTISITQEGTTNLTIKTYDNAGNVAALEEVIKLDKSLPESSRIEITGGVKNAKGWYNKDLTVKVIYGDDSLSEIDKVTYQLSGASTVGETDIENQGTIPITQNGTTNLTVKTYDKAGNIATLEEEIKLDKDLPTNSSIAITGGEKNEKGWYNKNLTVTVTHGGDELSGLDKVTYQMTGANNADETQIGNQGTISITENGITNLTIRTYDNAGNMITLQEEIKLDKDVPENSKIEITGGVKNAEEWYNKDLTVKIIYGKDAISDIDKVTYQLSGASTAGETEIGDQGTISITQNGTTNLTVKTYDNAGNVITLEEEIKLDKDLPTNSSIAITGGEKNENEWYNQNLTVKVTHGNDSLSGLDRVTYQMIGAHNVVETNITNQGTISITQDGITNLTVRTYDKAGNIAVLEEVIRLDKLKPTELTLKPSEITSTSFKLTATANDAVSGMKTYEFFVDEDSYKTVTTSEKTASVSVTNLKTTKHSTKVIVTDKAGNKEETSLEVANTELQLADISNVVFEITSFTVDEDNGNKNDYFDKVISDTSLTKASKYIQLSSKLQSQNNKTGEIQGKVKMVRTDGVEIEELEYFPKNLVFTFGYESKGSGTTFSHKTVAEVFGQTVHSVESASDKVTGITKEIDMTTLLSESTKKNNFTITEKKLSGTSSSTMLTISKIKLGDKELEFRIVDKSES